MAKNFIEGTWRRTGSGALVALAALAMACGDSTAPRPTITWNYLGVMASETKTGSMALTLTGDTLAPSMNVTGRIVTVQNDTVALAGTLNVGTGVISMTGVGGSFTSVSVSPDIIQGTTTGLGTYSFVVLLRDSVVTASWCGSVAATGSGYFAGVAYAPQGVLFGSLTDGNFFGGVGTWDPGIFDLAATIADSSNVITGTDDGVTLTGGWVQTQVSSGTTSNSGSLTGARCPSPL